MAFGHFSQAYKETYTYSLRALHRHRCDCSHSRFPANGSVDAAVAAPVWIDPPRGYHSLGLSVVGYRHTISRAIGFIHIWWVPVWVVSGTRIFSILPLPIS